MVSTLPLIDRRDPAEELALPSGRTLHPIAGCGVGGTYYLCGEAGTGERSVLYADSEGRAALIGADLVEAITLIVVLPFWHDLAKGFAISELSSDLRADHPDFDAERDRLLQALELASFSKKEATLRLLTVTAHTAPDYLSRVSDDDHLPYELLFPSGPA
ncbi:hypothetical protein ACIRUY_12455 [Streptomyces erythrochromogenes]|uniref:hypothetical protein n=1 Tax=Streptomyces erythrochromogenes TaxID=285574 RepID=UPI0038247762